MKYCWDSQEHANGVLEVCVAQTSNDGKQSRRLAGMKLVCFGVGIAIAVGLAKRGGKLEVAICCLGVCLSLLALSIWQRKQVVEESVELIPHVGVRQRWRRGNGTQISNFSLFQGEEEVLVNEVIESWKVVSYLFIAPRKEVLLRKVQDESERVGNILVLFPHFALNQAQLAEIYNVVHEWFKTCSGPPTHQDSQLLCAT